MIAALLLGLVLVAVPLYLWRRPRIARPAEATSTEGSGVLNAASFAPAATPSGTPGEGLLVGPPPAAVTLSEARVLSCHDPGPRKTPPEQCDHLGIVEQALAKSITEAAACVPAAAGGGSLVYVVDVSFSRKRNPIAVTLPRDGRALGGPSVGRSSRDRGSPSTARIAAACNVAVKRALSAIPPESLSTTPHAHARYKVAITASYPGPPADAPRL